MRAAAFCPAHITGFFKAQIDDRQHVNNLGSTGAGFSIKQGVTTRVETHPRINQNDNFQITLKGYKTDKTDVSQFVLNDFLSRGRFEGLFFDIRHEISIPVGYGLGSSGAVALSLSYALDRALGTNLKRHEIGSIAHNAEVSCKTGLGDVLASFHGGFEIRTKAGAPGVGSVEKINADSISVLVICFSPVSTNKFIKEQLPRINGLGDKMVGRLLKTRNCEQFQDMSLEFADYVGVITPRMKRVIDDLSAHGIKCGVALFGETVFSMISPKKEGAVLDVLKRHGGEVIRTELDRQGARILYN